MESNACNKILLVMVAAGLVAACDHTVTRPDMRTINEFAYLPIKVKSNPDLEFAGKPLPAKVTNMCREQTPGAVGIIFLDWLAKRIVGGIKRRVAREIAMYSSEISTPETYLAFYDPGYWRTDGQAQVSCFAAVRRSCEVPADSGRSNCSSQDPINFLFVGQYRRTEQYLQLRPLWAGITGMPGKSHPGAPASLTMALTLITDWHTSSGGVRSKAIKHALYDAKFTVSQKAQELPVRRMIWSELPYLPLPPRSLTIDDNGHVAPVLVLSSASMPPKGARWLYSFLDEQGSSLSKELKSSLEDLLE